MVKYLLNHEINRNKWDQCVASAYNGIIYGYSWYLDIVNEGWEGLIYGDYECVFPLTRGEKFGISYLFQPFFTQQLGLFASAGHLVTNDFLEEFINAIPDKYKFVEINLNTFNSLDSEKFQTKQNITYHLDLINDYQSLSGSYATNLKRNLNKADKYKLFLQKNDQPDPIVSLFRQNRGMAYSNINDKHYQRLIRIMYEALNRQMAHVWGVYSRRNVLCGGAFFLESNGKSIFIFSATDVEARLTGAMPFLIDTFIRENSQKNLVLDFEGSNDPNLARFYKGFGSTECVYLQIRINNLPWFLKWLK
jgi:hypothetical protein